MNTEQLINFIEFLNSFANIKRGVKLKDKNDFENDAEHSFQLALTAWYVADGLKLKINRQMILEYALVHDLVEVYAGDTQNFNKNAPHDTKHEREHKAKLKIKENFSDFTSLNERIDKYELLADMESKLVYILDKVLPNINTYLANDDYYEYHKATKQDYDTWFESKLEKSHIDDTEVLNLIQGIREFLKGKIVFYKNTNES